MATEGSTWQETEVKTGDEWAAETETGGGGEAVTLINISQTPPLARPRQLMKAEEACHSCMG
jgi:hypothetical protein